MFSLLAVLITILLLGSALLWRAARDAPWHRWLAVLRRLWRRGAVTIDRLFPSRGLLDTRDRQAGAKNRRL